MTTPPSAVPSRRNIPALHAAIAPSSQLQWERRALYQFAVHLLGCDSSLVFDLDVIDSPLVRSHIGDALAGRASFKCSELVGINALAGVGGTTELPRAASRPEANMLLAGALNTVGAELGRQQAALGSPKLLTETDGDQFISALAVLRDGVALARSVSPKLTDDLLAHIALVGIVSPQHAGRLASASPRAFPGLILLKSPQSPIEVAEALVHEGAHQKFFDFAIAYDLLNANSDHCPLFHPPWTPMERRWPLEQALAACHAYACLACFAQNAGAILGSETLGTGSLLLVARERSEIIGQWLLDRGDHLGADAHTLLEGLLGQRPYITIAAQSCHFGPVAVDYVVDTALEFRRCRPSERVLVGRPSQPPQLYWISEDAATLLELLEHKPINEIVETLAQYWHATHFDAIERLKVLLSDLCTSGLVTQKSRIV